MTDAARTEPVDPDDQGDPDDDEHQIGRCETCGHLLVAEPSKGQRALDSALNSILVFCERLFSPEGRPVRILVYAAVLGWLAFSVLRDVWRDAGTKWTVDGVFVRQWLREGEQPWYTTAAFVLVALLVFHSVRRRWQIERGIKSPPWILIMFVAMGALGVSIAAGLLLFKFAPDQNGKFDAIKTAIAMFAGTAGVGALVLSLRTHFTGETDRLNTQFDAAAQKLTDKSGITQSIGLLALQRLARRQAAYRTTVNELLQAYVELHGKPNPDGDESKPQLQATWYLANRILEEFARP